MKKEAAQSVFIFQGLSLLYLGVGFNTNMKTWPGECCIN
ncbi:hypothetical protein B4168_1434 [Anoxybacillus flavithermus]|nr:hypothetical protein B4168_1434 [Anoxybacillus flavithermus]OAO84091.1 hypothetical protein GT23_3626 [Parageobacillus thermoglucosidasius]